jgi:hypothetical protein
MNAMLDPRMVAASTTHALACRLEPSLCMARFAIIDPCIQCRSATLNANHQIGALFGVAAVGLLIDLNPN